MPEASPDPVPPQQPAPQATPPSGSPPGTSPSRPPVVQQPQPVQRSVQPRRFGMLAVGIFFVFLIAVVIVTVLLSGGEGSQQILENQFGIPAADLKSVIFTFIGIVYGLAAMVSIVFMLVGGFRAATSLGDPREAQRGRRTLFTSLGILIFLFASYVVFYKLLGAPTEKAPPPKVSIELKMDEKRQAPLKVQFNVTSSYPRDTTSYDWDFGDDTTQNASHPGSISHTYEKASSESKPYVAVLRISQGGKLIEQYKKEIEVRKSEALASFELLPREATGPAPFTINVDASTSRPGPGAGPTLTYEWDFGEAVAADAKAEKQEVRMEHKYRLAQEEPYIVKLTVTDDQGQSAVVTKEVTVTASKSDPVARVTTSPIQKQVDPNDIDPKNPDNLPIVSGVAPLTVTFSAASSESPNGKITDYTWSYGDGSGMDRGRAASHTFSTIGNYVTELTVIDVEGKSGSTRLMVRVLAEMKAPRARIESIPPSNGSSIIGNAPFKIALSGAGSSDEDGKILAYSWDFGDTGAKGEGERVEHTYTRPGEYFIKLVVTDDTELQSAPATLQVKVNKSPDGPLVADIKPTPPVPSGTIPLVVDFDGSGSIAPNTIIVNYSWDFGDQSPKVNSGAKVTHIYKLAGLYTVRLTITAADGRMAEATATVSAQEPPPVAKIETDKTVVNVGMPITFRGDGSRGNIQSWYWDFGDGTAESGRQISHKFATPNYYTVKLIVTDVNNQTDQATIRVEVN